MVTGHYRLETKLIGRATGKVSVVAKAAYRSGQALKDVRADKTFNYRPRSQEVAYSEIMAPESAPDWLKGEVPARLAGTQKQRDVREQLWNTIEGIEKRKDSQLAREFIASLPRGLNREQQVELVRGWCQSEFVGKGFVVDLALHKSKKGNNPHAHILCTTRPVTAEGFGKKPDTAGKFNGRGAAGIGAKNDLDQWRESWENHVNVALEKAGRPERVDRRSLKDRGIDKMPEPKIGVAATAMKRRGILADPDVFRRVRQIKLWNEVKPIAEAIRRFGAVPQYGIGKTWWQHSANIMRHVHQHVRQSVKGAWQKWVDSKHATRHEVNLER